MEILLSEFCSGQELIAINELNLRVAKSVSQGDVASVDCYRIAPTLQELRRIGKLAKAKGLVFNSERGEWTSDFVDFTHHVKQAEGYILCEYISKPERIEKVGNQWLAHGGERFQISLPPSGWVMPNEDGRLYDDRTGTPLRTIMGDESVMGLALESNGSFFWRTDLEDRDRFIVVNRECERWDGDIFEIGIVQVPDFSHDNIGVRCVDRE